MAQPIIGFSSPIEHYPNHHILVWPCGSVGFLLESLDLAADPTQEAVVELDVCKAVRGIGSPVEKAVLKVHSAVLEQR